MFLSLYHYCIIISISGKEAVRYREFFKCQHEYAVKTLSEKCSTNHDICQEKSRTKLEQSSKIPRKNGRNVKRRFDYRCIVHCNICWVSDACYKRHTYPGNVNKTVTVSGECPRNQPNQSFEKNCQSVLFGHQTHCLVSEGEFNFDLAEKKPDLAKMPDKWTKKCNLVRTFKKVVAEKIDQLVVELGAKLSYNSCIRAKEENYHRDYMQRFLSVVTVITSAINYKHFISLLWI